MLRGTTTSTLFPYTTLFRSLREGAIVVNTARSAVIDMDALTAERAVRSEEHTSELQSRFDLVCRLLLEKKKNAIPQPNEWREAREAAAGGGWARRARSETID